MPIVIMTPKFDRLWKGASSIFTRKQAYDWLSDRLGGHHQRVHIGSMGEGMCNLVIAEARRIIRIHKAKQREQENN